MRENIIILGPYKKIIIILGHKNILKMHEVCSLIKHSLCLKWGKMMDFKFKVAPTHPQKFDIITIPPCPC
jgi:hypothetical protein